MPALSKISMDGERIALSLKLLHSSSLWVKANRHTEAKKWFSSIQGAGGGS